MGPQRCVPMGLYNADASIGIRALPCPVLIWLLSRLLQSIRFANAVPMPVAP